MVRLYQKVVTLMMCFLLAGSVYAADPKAKRVRITDAGSYYTGTEVEAALQEVGAGTAGVWYRDVGNGFLYPLTIADNVGIGTTAPSQKLEVDGVVKCGGSSAGQSIIASGLVVNEDGLATAADDFRAETDTVSDAFEVDASADQVNINTDFQIQPEVDSTTAIQVLDSDGGTPILNIDTTNERVGIGTPGPEKSLHIVGSGFLVEGSGASFQVKRQNSGSVTMFDLSSDSPLTSIFQFIADNPNNLAMIQYRNGRDLSFYSTSETMRLTASGNIGIGTTAPARTLEVDGTLRVNSLGAGEDNSVLILDSDLDIHTDEIDSKVWGTALVDGAGAADHIAYWTDADSLADDYRELTWDATNNRIGIGINSPTTAVDVNSNMIRIRTAKTPAAPDDTGNVGEICWDAEYIYVCVDRNSWKRVAISEW